MPFPTKHNGQHMFKKQKWFKCFWLILLVYSGRDLFLWNKRIRSLVERKAFLLGLQARSRVAWIDNHVYPCHTSVSPHISALASVCLWLWDANVSVFISNAKFGRVASAAAGFWNKTFQANWDVNGVPVKVPWVLWLHRHQAKVLAVQEVAEEAKGKGENAGGSVAGWAAIQKTAPIPPIFTLWLCSWPLASAFFCRACLPSKLGREIMIGIVAENSSGKILGRTFEFHALVHDFLHVTADQDWRVCQVMPKCITTMPTFSRKMERFSWQSSIIDMLSSKI